MASGAWSLIMLACGHGNVALLVTLLAANQSQLLKGTSGSTLASGTALSVFVHDLQEVAR